MLLDLRVKQDGKDLTIEMTFDPRHHIEEVRAFGRAVLDSLGIELTRRGDSVYRKVFDSPIRVTRLTGRSASDLLKDAA